MDQDLPAVDPEKVLAALARKWEDCVTCYEDSIAKPRPSIGRNLNGEPVCQPCLSSEIADAQRGCHLYDWADSTLAYGDQMTVEQAIDKIAADLRENSPEASENVVLQWAKAHEPDLRTIMERGTYSEA